MSDPDPVLVASLTAHRACGGYEHDTANGKIHGYCVVCLVPWPCDVARVAVDAAGRAVGEAAPINMVLHCPGCGLQHIDAPEPGTDWTNPPHKSHKCHGCPTVWRPADVPTNGVAAIATRGKADTWPPPGYEPGAGLAVDRATGEESPG